MKVKFGIKASAMLASLALATVFVAGCTEETPPETEARTGPAPSSRLTARMHATPVTAPKSRRKK